MTKEEIFNYFSTQSASYSVTNIILTMIYCVIIGAVIFLTYRYCHHRVTYSFAFNVSLIEIIMIAAVIMMMIASNIVISLGMVGALSIVRFRTAIKNSQDTVFIFWAITEGLCIGSQNLLLAITTTLSISAVIMIAHSFIALSRNYIILIRGIEVSRGEICNVIDKYTKGWRLDNEKLGEHEEYIIRIHGKKNIDERISRELFEIKGVEEVNILPYGDGEQGE